MYKSKRLKAFLLTTITSLSLCQAMKIDKKSIFTPQKLGEVSLYHANHGFQIRNSSKVYPVQPCYMDKELRGISKDQLVKIIAAGGYLSVNKMSDSDEYSLRLQGRIKGGGAGGAAAGFWVGKGLTYFVSYSGIAIASAFTGPAAPATFATLSALATPAIEGASNAVGLGAGVAGGVATGPV